MSETKAVYKCQYCGEEFENDPAGKWLCGIHERGCKRVLDNKPLVEVGDIIVCNTHEMTHPRTELLKVTKVYVDDKTRRFLYSCSYYDLMTRKCIEPAYREYTDLDIAYVYDKAQLKRCNSLFDGIKKMLKSDETNPSNAVINMSMSNDEATLSIAVPYTIKDVNPAGYFGEINEN